MITQTDTLNMLMKVYNSLPEDARAEADEYISGNIYKYTPTAAKEPVYHEIAVVGNITGALIGEMIRAIKCDITQSNIPRKSSAKKSVITKMLKQNVTYGRKEYSHYTYVDEDNRQWATDGVVVYIFSKVDDCFPICPADDKYLIEDGWKKLLAHDLLRFRNKCDKELELPSEKMLDAYVTLNKKRRDLPFAFGINLPTVDSRRLLDILKALPGVKLYWSGEISTYNHSEIGTIKICSQPLFGVDSNGNEIILLPIRDGCAFFAGSERTVL